MFERIDPVRLSGSHQEWEVEAYKRQGVTELQRIHHEGSIIVLMGSPIESSEGRLR
jgi:hypothetical protein